MSLSNLLLQCLAGLTLLVLILIFVQALHWMKIGCQEERRNNRRLPSEIRNGEPISFRELDEFAISRFVDDDD